MIGGIWGYHVHQWVITSPTTPLPGLCTLGQILLCVTSLSVSKICPNVRCELIMLNSRVWNRSEFFTLQWPFHSDSTISINGTKTPWQHNYIYCYRKTWCRGQRSDWAFILLQIMVVSMTCVRWHSQVQSSAISELQSVPWWRNHFPPETKHPAHLHVWPLTQFYTFCCLPRSAADNKRSL